MLVEVNNLAFGYRNDKLLFHNVSFTLDQGSVLSILGPNGAGKSTLLNCLANLLTPQSGEIKLKGKRLNEMKLVEVAQILGYVPQIHTPAYAYTVREFAVMGRAPYLGLFQRPSPEDYYLVDEVLKDLGIAHLSDRPYTELSGGERQLVTIARAIVQQPDIIMLDEPTAHLDYGNQLQIVKLIRKLANKGFAIIMTTHTPDHAILLDDQVGVLDYNGELTVGASEEILTEERLRKLYRSDLYLVYVEEVGRKVCVSGSLDSQEDGQKASQMAK